MFDTLKLSPTIDNKFIVLEEYTLHGVIVPRGYKTNGADIPRIFWILIPPFKPMYLPAVVIHDYLCSGKEYLKADNTFENILKDIGESIFTISMVKSVRAYHRYKYGMVMI